MYRNVVILTALMLTGAHITEAQNASAPAAKATRAGTPATPASTGIVTRGIGVYPGDPREDFAPTFTIDSTTYRNLARLRPAYHSSSYDYNLTAQLITDGVVDTAMPRRVVVSSGQQGLISTDIRDLPGPLSQGSLSGYSKQQMVWPKHKREWPMDDNWVTGFDLKGPQVWVQFDLLGGAEPLVIDEVIAQVTVENAKGSGPENWTCSVMGSDEGKTWTPLGHGSGMSMMGGDMWPTVKLSQPSRHRYVRVVFDDPRATRWRIGEVRVPPRGQVGARRRPAPLLQRLEERRHAARSGSTWTSARRARSIASRCTGSARRRRAPLQVSDDASAWSDRPATAGEGRPTTTT